MEVERQRDRRSASFKYLGFLLDREGGFKEHIKELARKGRRVLRKVWGWERDCVGMI